MAIAQLGHIAENRTVNAGSTPSFSSADRDTQCRPILTSSPFAASFTRRHRRTPRRECRLNSSFPSAFGVREASDFLAEHLGRAVGAVELVGEGAWSRCFGFHDDGRERVIRFGNFFDDFEKDRRASALPSPAAPVPEVTETGKRPQTATAISSRAYGEPLETPRRRQWVKMLPSLFALLDAMRTIDGSPRRAGYGGWDARRRREFRGGASSSSRSRPIREPADLRMAAAAGGIARRRHPVRSRHASTVRS